MGGKRWAGVSGQPVSNGMLGCGEHGCYELFPRAYAITPSLAFGFQSLPGHLLGMVGGVCCGFGVAGHSVGQLAGVLRALRPLLVAMAWAWLLQSAASDLCSARTVGSAARIAQAAAFAWLDCISNGNRHADASDVEQGRMDVRVLAVVAGLVLGYDDAGEANIRRGN